MPTEALAELERLRLEYGPGLGKRRLALLGAACRRRDRRPSELLRLHEALCFLRAFPDNQTILSRVETELARFATRPDLRRHADSLADSGIAGTAIRDRFFFGIARWLGAHWPSRIGLDRDEQAVKRALAAAWRRIARRYGPRPTARSVFARLDEARRAGESDAACWLRLLAALPAAVAERLHDAIEPTYDLLPAGDTPSRTAAHFPPAPRGVQRRALDQSTPSIGAELDRAPRSVRRLDIGQGRRLLNVACAAMVTRHRDLEAFSSGDPRTVRVIDDGRGLAFYLSDCLPERKKPRMHGVLMLRNRIPVGYFDVIMAGREAQMSFNIFESFRGAETGLTLARAMAMLRHALGARRFSLAPYQLGKDNDEALESGAWWFYWKMGFRPRAEEALRLAARELAARARNPARRSSRRTLARLAEHSMYYPAPR